MEKVVILGTGIAGLTAAIYAARANLAPLVIGGSEDGGQLTVTTTVENYPGFPDGVQGPELIHLCHKQAERFGARFTTGVVTGVDTKNHFNVIVDDKPISTKTLIIATGASARWLNVKGEQEYKGRGVTTCATCDGYFYRGKKVIVVGGGDSACEESLFLTKFTTNITLVHRRDALRASKIMQERVLKNRAITITWNTVVEEVRGDGKKVTAVLLKNTTTGQTREFPVDGVFLAIGHVPNTTFLKGVVALDQRGYIVTDRRTCTNIPGMFACGDVQDTIYRQAITAAGTGCQAAMEAEKYIEHLKE